uniref:Adaptin_N domain-containing protein n=1 Tax=Macrostomum lignano TaxID=282301 RepID=A0A1I8FF10_9PLAT
LPIFFSGGISNRRRRFLATAVGSVDEVFRRFGLSSPLLDVGGCFGGFPLFLLLASLAPFLAFFFFTLEFSLPLHLVVPASDHPPSSGLSGGGPRCGHRHHIENSLRDTAAPAARGRQGLAEWAVTPASLHPDARSPLQLSQQCPAETKWPASSNGFRAIWGGGPGLRESQLRRAALQMKPDCCLAISYSSSTETMCPAAAAAEEIKLAARRRRLPRSSNGWRGVPDPDYREIRDVVLQINGYHVTSPDVVETILAKAEKIVLGILVTAKGDGSVISSSAHHGRRRSRDNKAKELFTKLNGILGGDQDKKMYVVGLMKQYAEDRNVHKFAGTLLQSLLSAPEHRPIVQEIRAFVPDRHLPVYDKMLSQDPLMRASTGSMESLKSTLKSAYQPTL